ncbi:IS1595 family transposase [Candidatus Spongiisocius sp.]|uniref:IS1595 family transposase n=1 Tax=Candidatus Spongiisocius sp. TaxID=3101273 RepID=UPI003B5C255B
MRTVFGQMVPDDQMTRPVEVDQVYIGGLENTLRRSFTPEGRPVGKTAMVGTREPGHRRVVVRVVSDTQADTACQEFVEERSVPNVPLYTGGATAYNGLENREAVHHSVGEYVRCQAHTNGMESFWATLKRAHKGVFHRMSPKHLQGYGAEFAGRHNGELVHI